MKDTRFNIFSWATNELSLDAIMCYMIYCSRSEDKEEKELGNTFVSEFLFENKSEKYELVTLQKQFKHIDIFGIFLNGNKLYPVIIENKTDTFIGKDQAKRYCEKIDSIIRDGKKKSREKQLLELCDSRDFSKESNQFINGSVEDLEWANLRFVFYKTDLLLPSEEKEIEEQIKSLCPEIAVDLVINNVKKMIATVEKFKSINELMRDYVSYCKELQTQNDDVEAFWNNSHETRPKYLPDGTNLMNYYYSQYKLLEVADIKDSVQGHDRGYRTYTTAQLLLIDKYKIESGLEIEIGYQIRIQENLIKVEQWADYRLLKNNQKESYYGYRKERRCEIFNSSGLDSSLKCEWKFTKDKENNESEKDYMGKTLLSLNLNKNGKNKEIKIEDLIEDIKKIKAVFKN